MRLEREAAETAAEQQVRVDKMVRWYMRRRALQRFYPVLYPGSRMSEAWDWIVCTSILPSLICSSASLRVVVVLPPALPLPFLSRTLMQMSLRGL